MSEDETNDSANVAPWQPLERIDRRVVGVLVEKAKTTPENYPLSLNSLVNGCNQKSNRSPQMQLDQEQVDEAIQRLREAGAVSVVQSDGRVDKYRHRLYEWLGVDKVELAVMAELFLRGAQTLGELRGRAARMEPISSLAELQPLVDQLREKGLLIFLTPRGRGCVVTHALYQPQELDKLRTEYGRESTGETARSTPASVSPPSTSELQALREEVTTLQQQLAEMNGRIEMEMSQLRRDIDELKRSGG